MVVGKSGNLKVGDKVLIRTVGMDGKLVAAWDGPYEVISKCSPVSYNMLDVGRKLGRVCHIN